MSNNINSTLTENSAITKFNISPLAENNNGVLAVASATFYDTITVNSITIRQDSESGNLFVKLPQKRTQQGRYIDVTHPINAETRQQINETLLSAFKSGNFKQESAYIGKPKITAQNSFKYEAENHGNNLARLDIVVNDMVIHNCKIINGKDNEPFLSMPNYKGKDGNYHSIVVPSNASANKEMNLKAISEFNTDYTFRKFDDTQLTAIKEAGVAVTSRKNDNGDNIVKFKTADIQKVNSAIAHTTSIIQK